MHAKTLIVAASLALLGTAPAAWAHDPNEHDPNQETTQSYDYNYLDAGQMERVLEVAHEIDDTATSIHRLAERNNRRPSSRENEVLVRLHELNDRAHHFHAVVESNRQDPQHTADDFQSLLDSYYAVTDSLHTMRRRPYIDRGMNHISDLLDELTAFYGVDDLHNRSGSSNGYSSHGEYRPPVH